MVGQAMEASIVAASSDDDQTLLPARKNLEGAGNTRLKMSEWEPNPGQTISHYKLLEKLGGGGMGVVYKAEDTRLDRKVALKLLPRGLAHNEHALVRFRREAKAASALNHPNICAVYDIGDEGEKAFIVMEFLDGVTLKFLIGANSLDLGQLLEISGAVADALSAAHAKSIIHRDIKPENIFICDGGHPKVLDFGLAKINTPDLRPAESDTLALTEVGLVMGTLPYMSPEQLQGRCVDHRTDIFSLGAVVYEMATGQRPFSGETSLELSSSILRDTPKPVIELRPELPTGLHRIVDRCLSKEPEERYSSARELRDALDLLRRQLSPVSRGAVPVASIAVLPFTNMSSDPENEFFADGLTEEIMNTLTQIEELHVAARRSTSAFKGKHGDLRVVGERLNVTSVLEGSIRRAGGRTRINVQLVNVADGYHLWSESYEREVEDVFKVQDEISRAIASRLKVDLFSLIGGSLAVQTAVDVFLRRVLADESINHYFAGTDVAHLRAHQTMFISALLGGPAPYTGRDIGAAHARLRPCLTDVHFDAILKHFRASLQEIGVKDEKAERVMKLLEGKRNAVLNR